MNHHLGGIFGPQGTTLFRVERHGHDQLLVGTRLRMPLGIPYKLARGRPGEIAYVLSGKAPGRSLVATFRLVCQRLFRRHDINRSFSSLCLSQPVTLFTSEHVIGVLQFTSRRHNVICRHRHGNLVVTELQREFTRAKEFLIGPALIVGVSHQSRKPLRQGEDIVAALTLIVREVLIASTGTQHITVNNVVFKIYAQIDLITGLQRLGKIDSHQGTHNGVHQGVFTTVGDSIDAMPQISIFLILQTAQLTQTDARWIVAVGTRATAVESATHYCHGIRAEAILVQLEPEIGQGVRRIVAVGNEFRGGKALIVLIQSRVDIVVDFLLPVLMTRRTAGVSIDIRRWQNFVQLAELVFE